MNDSINPAGLGFSILSIELEPTHYKSDLWNAASTLGMLDVFVIYTQAKNWSPDGGHNYLRFPKFSYDHLVLPGRGLIGVMSSAIQVVKNIYNRKQAAVLICGYSSVPTLLALLSCYLFKRIFLLFVDEFNIQHPPGSFRALKLGVREYLRAFCFHHAIAVLVCGRRGIESALVAGCPPDKIVDFPYVVDSYRISTDMPEDIPSQCHADMAGGVLVLFFSGRMIDRKGLPTLLHALSVINTDIDWVLWIEGSGPELNRYIALCQRYGLQGRCRFLGFCQYDLHSWLLRSADIIIVPSLEDHWGIVVDEGLQLGKTVISSDATGSGYDRIIDGVNGYLFETGNSSSLAAVLERVLEARDISVESTAQSSLKNKKPIDNIKTLLSLSAKHKARYER